MQPEQWPTQVWNAHPRQNGANPHEHCPPECAYIAHHAGKHRAGPRDVAVAAFTMALVSLAFWPLGPVAVFLSVKSWKLHRHDHDGGRVMAAVSLALGILSTTAAAAAVVLSTRLQVL